jgi:hypothetical protein
MALFHSYTGHTIRADHVLAAGLPRRPQVQMILIQQPKHLPATHVQLLLKPAVVEFSAVRARQPRRHRLELLPGTVEHLIPGRGHVR